MIKERVVIIGAGPAGLTAVLEVIEKTNKKPIVYEAKNENLY